MSITPQLRAMIDARKAAEAKKAGNVQLSKTWNRLAAETLGLIDKAAPFMDEGCPPDKWPPSKLLEITYYAAATCGRSGAEKDALIFIHRMLERARRLWVGGFQPNPFLSDADLAQGGSARL